MQQRIPTQGAFLEEVGVRYVVWAPARHRVEVKIFGSGDMGEMSAEGAQGTRGTQRTERMDGANGTEEGAENGGKVEGTGGLGREGVARTVVLRREENGYWRGVDREGRVGD